MTSNHFIPFRYTRMLGYPDALGCALICSDIFGCPLIYSDASRPSQRVPIYSDALQYVPMRSVSFRSLRLLPVAVGAGLPTCPLSSSVFLTLFLTLKNARNSRIHWNSNVFKRFVPSVPNFPINYICVYTP